MTTKQSKTKLLLRLSTNKLKKGQPKKKRKRSAEKKKSQRKKGQKFTNQSRDKSRNTKPRTTRVRTKQTLMNTPTNTAAAMDKNWAMTTTTRKKRESTTKAMTKTSKMATIMITITLESRVRMTTVNSWLKLLSSTNSMRRRE